MAKKRKSDAAKLEEVDRTMYSTFCTAANSLSQLYTQAMNHQRLSFHAGERLSLEKLYQWIMRQQEEGSRMTNVDVVAYLQNELERGMEEPSTSPRAPFHQQSSQQAPRIQGKANPFGFTVTTLGARPLLRDPQTMTVFCNTISGSVHRNIEHCYLAQGSHHYPNSPAPGGTCASDDNIKESDVAGLNDSLMDECR